MDWQSHNQKFISGFAGPLAILSAALLILVYKDASISGGYLLDGQSYIIGRDFVNFWQYGVSFWLPSPELNYDPWHYNRVLDALIPGFDYPDQLWSYPPHFMLVMAPFGLVGYNWAFLIFNLLSFLIFWKIVLCPLQNKALALTLVAAPFFVICLISGQLSLLVVSAFVWLYRHMDKRPIASAIIIAFLTVKPQLGVLIPLFLLLSGRYRLFFYSCFSVTVFLLLSVAINGLAPWQAFFDTGVRMQGDLLAKGGSTPLVLGMMPTVLINASLAGLLPEVARMVHALYALPIVIWFVWFMRTQNDHLLQVGAMIAATFAITPYLMVYDLLAVVWLLVALSKRSAMHVWQQWGWRLYMLLPILSVLMAKASIPGSALLSLLPILWLTHVGFNNNFRTVEKSGNIKTA